MRINEKGTNMQITPEIKNYLFKKLEHLEKFLDPADDSILCEVEIGKTTKHHKNGVVFRTEINLYIAHKNLRAVSEMDELLSSIDVAKDEMVRELQLNKDKKMSLMRRGGAKIKNILKGILGRE